MFKMLWPERNTVCHFYKLTKCEGLEEKFWIYDFEYRFWDEIKD